MERSGFFRMDVVEPDVAEGVEAVEDANGRVVGWRRNIYSYPPVGGPDGGAHVTVPDLLRFHRALVEGRLLGPALTAELLSPKERHSTSGPWTRMTGFGFEFETDADGVVRSYWKEGVNVGVSGILQYYPAHAVTTAVLAVGEHAAWTPMQAIERSDHGERADLVRRQPPTSSYANICSCRAWARSSTPTSTRSTRRSSSATTRACAAGR